MWNMASTRALLRRMQRSYSAAATTSTMNSMYQQTSAATGVRNVSSFPQTRRESSTRVLAIAAAAAATSAAIVWGSTRDAQQHVTALCDAPTPAEPAEGGYKDTPIQHVAALLMLYDEIDKNMEVLGNRMLEDLQKRVTTEKAENGGKLRVTPEQIALHMSIEFESTLEKVQDAVFRNNYVAKEQVQDALQRLVKGELRGGGANGKLTVQEAEAIEGYVKRLERLRWKVTGSREPLIPTHNRPLITDSPPTISVATVVVVMEKLIPMLTSEMEAIVQRVRTDAGDKTAAQQQQAIAQQYIKRSGELTAQLCTQHQLDLREFQAALVFYHEDPAFEKALARLSADQQRRFTALGL